MTAGDSRADDRIESLPHRAEDTLDRRSLLKLSGVGVIGAIAGCTEGQSGSSGDGTSGTSGSGSSNPGDPVSIEVWAPEFLNFADIMRERASQWQKNLGIETNFKTMAWSSFLSEIYVNGKYNNVTLNGYGGAPERIDPQFYLGLAYSENKLNISNYQNDEYDSLYEELTSTMDQEERNRIIKELQTIWYEELPRLSFQRKNQVVPVNTKLWDVKPVKFLGVTAQAITPWIEAAPKTDTRTAIMGGTFNYKAPNPLAQSGTVIQSIFKMAYDTLYRIDYDGTYKGAAVENIEIVDDTTLDFFLRPGMTFHDGEDVTVEDLKFSFDLLNDYSWSQYDGYLSNVEETEITDDAVRLHLSEPDALLQTSTAGYVPLLPKHIWSEAIEDSDQPNTWGIGDNQYVGSGPFQVVSASSDRIELKAYPDHYNAPKYDRFIYKVLGGTEALRAELQSEGIHTIDVGEAIPVAVEIAKGADFLETVGSPGLNTGEIAWDVTTPPFDDLAIRKAIRHGTNVEKVGELYHLGRTDYSDGTVIHPELQYGRKDLPTTVETYDVEKAKSILSDAGYTWDENGTLRYPTE